MRTETILLFEHEPVISFYLKMELVQMGFRVYQAFQLSEAMEICRTQLPGVALINFRQEQLTDGMSLAGILRARFQMKVLLITGSRSEDIEMSPHFFTGQEVLYKPFSHSQLRQAIGSFF